MSEVTQYRQQDKLKIMSLGLTETSGIIMSEVNS